MDLHYNEYIFTDIEVYKKDQVISRFGTWFVLFIDLYEVYNLFRPILLYL